MRLNGTWPRAPRDILQDDERTDTQESCQSSSCNGLQAIVSAEQPNGETSEIPQPSIASTGSRNGPEPDPPRRSPLVHLAHQLVIAGRKKLKHGVMGRHRRRPVISKSTRFCISLFPAFLLSAIP